MRQASRRAWRLGQSKDCRVYYLHDAQTMQHRAMQLMARKMAAAMALDGELNVEGLTAMADDESAAMALARSISNAIDTADIHPRSATPTMLLRKSPECCSANSCRSGLARHRLRCDFHSSLGSASIAQASLKTNSKRKSRKMRIFRRVPETSGLTRGSARAVQFERNGGGAGIVPNLARLSRFARNHVETRRRHAQPA